MGHIRLGKLPAGKKWTQVVELLRVGGSVAELAAATADAAEKELDNAKGDPTLAYTVWLLTQLPLAARSSQYHERLSELGFSPSADQSILALVAGFAQAVDSNTDRHGRTDLGELARLAASESLTALIGTTTPSLFGSIADDLQRELGRLGSRDRFASLARDFFARLTQKTLEYYISRELSNHVGPGKKLASIAHQNEFRDALERHCREASLIVEEFAGGWYSKSNFLNTLTPASAQGFADYALTKMRDELRARRGGDA